MIGEFGETIVLDWGLAKVRGVRDIRSKDLAAEIKEFQDAQVGKPWTEAPLARRLT